MKMLIKMLLSRLIHCLIFSCCVDVSAQHKITTYQTTQHVPTKAYEGFEGYNVRH